MITNYNPIKTIHNKALEHVEHYNNNVAPTHYNEIILNQSFDFGDGLVKECKYELKDNTFPSNLIKVVDITYAGLEILLK
mgnify:CR=1 FL=1|jgi:hypothetical protein